MPATNKLKLFGENITAAKIRTDSDWDASMNRKTGFTNGDAADALDVNTAIKTNSLVAIALAGVVADYLPSGEIGLTTALADMQTFIKNAFNLAITFTKTADTTNGDAVKLQVFNNAVKQFNITNAAHAKDADTALACSGNAATATKLKTARKIAGVLFDGSADINLSGVNTPGNQDTSGNAATATKLKTARTINISDSDASYTGTAASFDGSGNVTIKLPATIKAALVGNVTGNADTATNASKLNNKTATTTVPTQYSGDDTLPTSKAVGLAIYYATDKASFSYDYVGTTSTSFTVEGLINLVRKPITLHFSGGDGDNRIEICVTMYLNISSIASVSYSSTFITSVAGVFCVRATYISDGKYKFEFLKVSGTSTPSVVSWNTFASGFNSPYVNFKEI